MFSRENSIFEVYLVAITMHKYLNNKLLNLKKIDV